MGGHSRALAARQCPLRPLRRAGGRNPSKVSPPHPILVALQRASPPSLAVPATAVELKMVPKDDETKSMLRAVVAAGVLFGGLSDAQR